jgi:hypothetical protein
MNGLLKTIEREINDKVINELKVDKLFTEKANCEEMLRAMAELEKGVKVLDELCDW